MYTYKGYQITNGAQKDFLGSLGKVLVKASITGGAILAGLALTPIFGLAYTLKMIIKEIQYVLTIAFLPAVAIYKLVKFVGAYMDKREKLAKYMEAIDDDDTDTANDMRVAEAERIVKALESLDNDKNLDEKMSPKQRDKFRESMIKFFSDEDRDMSALMDTTRKMERIAKENKGKKKSVNLIQYGIDSQSEDYPYWMAYAKAVSYAQETIMSSGIKSFSAASEEPSHNNHENYRTVHN